MNGVSQKFYNQAKASKIVRDKKFTVLYSGNMGLAQDLKTVIETAKLLKDYEIYFQFIGDGVCRDEIIQLSKPINQKISFFNSMPREK